MYYRLYLKKKRSSNECILTNFVFSMKLYSYFSIFIDLLRVLLSIVIDLEATSVTFYVINILKIM